MKYAVPFFYSAVSFLPIKEITASRKEKESVHRAKIGRKRCGGTGFFGRKVEKKKSLRSATKDSVGQHQLER